MPYVQSGSTQYIAGAATRTVTLSSSVTAGSLIVVAQTVNYTSIPATVTDNQGNTYTQAGTTAVNGANRAAIFYAVAGSSGSLTVTVGDTTLTSYGALGVAEYTGFGAPVSTASDTGTGTVIGCGTPTPSGTCLIVGVGCQGTNTYSGTAGAGFTLRLNLGNATFYEALYLVDQETASTVTPTVAIGASIPWAGVSAAFGPSAPTPDPARPSVPVTEVLWGPAYPGAPWVARLPQPPLTQNSPPDPGPSPNLWTPEVTSGPIRGAPWGFAQQPVQIVPVVVPPPPPPSFPVAETFWGPAVPGAPWGGRPPLEEGLVHVNVRPVPPTPPVVPGQGKALPLLPRVPDPKDPNFQRRLSRHTEILHDFFNSLVRKGQVVQNGPADWDINAAGTAGGTGLTGTFP